MLVDFMVKITAELSEEDARALLKREKSSEQLDWVWYCNENRRLQAELIATEVDYYGKKQ